MNLDEQFIAWCWLPATFTAAWLACGAQLALDIANSGVEKSGTSSGS